MHLLLLLLLTPSLSQDISFPSFQDDSDNDTEYIQIQHAPPMGSNIPQAMTEYHPGGSSPAGGPGAPGASGGFSGGAYPGGLPGGPPGEGSGGGYGEVGGVAAGVMDLGLAIHRVARNEGKKQWWVYSPTSVASALYMVLLGANGKTYTELSRLLGVNSISSSLKPHEDFTSTLRNLQYTGNEKNVVKLANGLFVQNDFSIRQDYKDIIRSLYQATLQSLDFRLNASHARDVINSWVSEKTLGKIPQILSEVPPPETKIVLTSSLYFKGEWASPFPSELTKLQNFYPNGRTQPAKLKVPMLATQGNYRYYHDKLLNCEVVGIPYKGETIMFYLVLPHNSNQEKLKTLENQLSHSEIERLTNNAVLTDDVIVAMPKMKLSSDYLLNSVLQELGLRSLFDPKEADLSLLSSGTSPPRPQPGPVEDEDRFVFTRMKKPNASVEERRRRYINDGMESSRDSFEDAQQSGIFKDDFGRFGHEEQKNSAVNSGRASEGKQHWLPEPQYETSFQYPGLSKLITHLKRKSSRDQVSKSSTYNPWLGLSRKKRQLENPSSSHGILPSGRSDNSLDPGRHLRTLSNPGLYVNQVVHKVVVDINEKGTEAAATTAVSMSKTLSHMVKADTPFLFFIRHEPTKLVLFWGSVVTPPVAS